MSERILTIKEATFNASDIPIWNSATQRFEAGSLSSILDDDLDAIAALAGTSGVLCKTAANTWALRTLQGETSVLVWTNPAGVAGNPTISIDTDFRDGWTPAEETWTYASATTITVPAPAASKYQVGDKIRLVNSGNIDYFYIVGVSNTTLTITGGSDYSLVNSAITSPFYSHQESPLGFPQVFNYSPTFTGFSANPSVTARFSLIGRKCFLTVLNNSGGTSNATGFTVSLPITAAAGITYVQGGNQGNDNLGYQNNVLASIASAGTSVTLLPQGGSVNWSNTGTKNATFQISYNI